MSETPKKTEFILTGNLPCDQNEWFINLTPASKKEIREVQQEYYEALLSYYKAAEVGEVDSALKDEYKTREGSVIVSYEKLGRAYENHGVNTMIADVEQMQRHAEQNARTEIDTKTSIGDLRHSIPDPQSPANEGHRGRISLQRGHGRPSSFLNPGS